MNVDLSHIATQMVGKKVPKPLSGTLSGHAAGEPFDKLVYTLLKAQNPGRVYRQYEYLNELYSKNLDKLTYDERIRLVESPALQYLLNRGKSVTGAWSMTNLFEEKQNDTADIIVTEEGLCNLVDVKTVNNSKNAQPPNIISALKLAKMCKLMIENDDYNSHGIFYFEVKWGLDGENLVCTESTYKDLFKTKPENLYINWAAALQVQFHVNKLPQDFEGTKEAWCRSYMHTFVFQAERRIEKMKAMFIDPFKID